MPFDGQIKKFLTKTFLGVCGCVCVCVFVSVCGCVFASVGIKTKVFSNGGTTLAPPCPPWNHVCLNFLQDSTDTFMAEKGLTEF
jgi:hypothetical protein